MLSPIALVIGRAPAKINVQLRVLDRRADGYHTLETLFHSIAIFDTITCRRRTGPFELRCAAPGVPLDSSNLIWRAAQALWRSMGRSGEPADVEITLSKRIPLQAGLGGGSSDAAAALRCLSLLWGGAAPARLPGIAAALGADVPFFLVGGAARGHDRGDALIAARPFRSYALVLLVPSFGVSTADAYRWLDADRDAGRAAVPGAPLVARDDRPAIVDPGRLPALVNDLEAPVAQRHPEITALKAALVEQGAVDAAMSGSGSTVFGLFETALGAQAAARRLRGRIDARPIVTRTLGRAAYRRLMGPTVRRALRADGLLPRRPFGRVAE